MRKKKLSFASVYDKYIHGHIKPKKYQTIGISLLIVVISGFLGWMWEFVFTFFNEGCTEWYMKGGNLLPWMNIYAIGALFVIPLTYKFRKYPWAVFVIAFFVTGIVELLGGWLVYTIGDGTRYWDYNNQPWNFGNIGGFVCFLSVTVFASASLLLMYVIFPFCIYLSLKIRKRDFLTLAIVLFSIVMFDELTNLTLKNLNMPTAMDFYQSIGWKYK